MFYELIVALLIVLVAAAFLSVFASVNSASGRVSSYTKSTLGFTTKCIIFFGGEQGCWVWNNSIPDHPTIDNQTICSVTEQGRLWLKNLSCKN